MTARKPPARRPRTPVKPGDPFQSWAVSQAIDHLIGGPLPYDPDIYSYQPPNRLYAQTILLNSALLAAINAEHRGDRLDRYAVRRRYITTLNRLGVPVIAPFADRLGRIMLSRGAPR